MGDLNESAIGAADFVAYAQDDVSKWNACVKQQITHTAFGVGIINRAERGNYYPDSAVTLIIDFEGKPSTNLCSAYFANPGIITDFEIPPLLVVDVAKHAEQARRTDAERAARKKRAEDDARALLKRHEAKRAKSENRRLQKQKYFIHEEIDPNLDDELHRILDHLDAKQRSVQADEVLLERQKLFGPLATFLEREVESGRYVRLAKKVSKYLRRADQPPNAMRVLQQIDLDSIHDPVSLAVYFTALGTVYRRLGKLPEALSSANLAISLDPDYYIPFNLRGGVHFDLGRIKSGEADFDHAAELAARSGKILNSTREIRGVVTKQKPEIRARTAASLIAIDGDTYAWARIYIKKRLL